MCDLKINDDPPNLNVQVNTLVLVRETYYLRYYRKNAEDIRKGIKCLLNALEITNHPRYI